MGNHDGLPTSMEFYNGGSEPAILYRIHTTYQSPGPTGSVNENEVCRRDQVNDRPKIAIN